LDLGRPGFEPPPPETFRRLRHVLETYTDVTRYPRCVHLLMDIPVHSVCMPRLLHQLVLSYVYAKSCSGNMINVQDEGC
jgi:hypothetical protein